MAPDQALAQALQDADFRVPMRQYFAGKRYVAYALPREFDGLLQEARAVTKRGRGRWFFHSPGSKGTTVKFTVCDETGGTLLWVNVHKGPDNIPPAEDVMVLELAPREEFTVWPYQVVQVRRLREDAAA
jgi:hypothetical protein